MDHGDPWKDSIRTALHQPGEGDDGREGVSVSDVMIRGRQRLAAHAGTRVAAVGAAAALAVAWCAYQWSEIELARTAHATLTQGVPWIP